MKNLISIIIVLSVALMLGGCGGKGSGPVGPGPEPEPEKEWATVTFTVSPPDLIAVVILDGIALGPAPQAKTLEVGETSHTLKFEVLGATLDLGSFKIKKAGPTTLTLTAEQLGVLTISGQVVDKDSSAPIKNARIEALNADGQTIGYGLTDIGGNFKFYAIDQLIHSIKVSAASYNETILSRAEIEKGMEIKLAKPVIPTTGAIRVITSPPGATVFIDGTEVGVSPLEQTGLSPGPHAVKTQLDGYEGQEKSLEVAIGRTTDWTPTLTLLPKVIDFFPTDAEWLFDKGFPIPEKIRITRQGNTLGAIYGPKGTITDDGKVNFKMDATWTYTGTFDPHEKRMSGTASSTGGSIEEWSAKCLN